MQLSACNPQGPSSSCTFTAKMSAAATATTVAATATWVEQLQRLLLLRLLQLRLPAHQPYVATPATPLWHTLWSARSWHALGAVFVTATCNVYRCCHCISQPTRRVQTASCKLQAANRKLPTANCKLCCYGTGIAIPTTQQVQTAPETICEVCMSLNLITQPR